MHILTNGAKAPQYRSFQFPKARPPRAVPTLLELHHIPERSCVDHYCDAIRRYLLGQAHPDFIDEQEMLTRMGTR